MSVSVIQDGVEYNLSYVGDQEERYARLDSLGRTILLHFKVGEMLPAHIAGTLYQAMKFFRLEHMINFTRAEMWVSALDLRPPDPTIAGKVVARYGFYDTAVCFDYVCLPLHLNPQECRFALVGCEMSQSERLAHTGFSSDPPGFVIHNVAADLFFPSTEPSVAGTIPVGDAVGPQETHMPREDADRSKINKQGNLVVRIDMHTEYSLQKFNRNDYTILEDSEGVRMQSAADGPELSAVERGHIYYAQQVGDNQWAIYSPYRVADQETAEIGAGIRPMPDNIKLTTKFGAAAQRWQGVASHFFLSNRTFKKFREEVAKIGGRTIVNHADPEMMEYFHGLGEGTLESATQILLQMQNLKASLTADNGGELILRLGTLSESLEPLHDAIEKSLDGFRREHILLKEEYGKVEKKKVAERQDKQLRVAVARSRTITAEAMKIPHDAKVLFGQAMRSSRNKAKVAETLKDAVENLRVVFPQLGHLNVQDDGTILVEYSPGNCVQVTQHGVDLVSPERKIGGAGRMRFLEV